MKQQANKRKSTVSKNAWRLVKYVFKSNKLLMPLIIFFTFLNAAATASTGIFVYVVTNHVIIPVIDNGVPTDNVLYTLIATAISCAVVYGLGLIGSFGYSWLTAIMGQRTLNLLRKDMFLKMESLPVKYFDQNKHGDIMSHYTNDIDAIRQFISQSLVQFFNIGFTLIIVTLAMLYFSLWLTLLLFVCAVAMVIVTQKLGGRSSKNFVKQQKVTAELEGFVEEAMNGAKVIKVFSHEQQIIDDFKKVNKKVKQFSSKANEDGNMVGPILNGIGNYMYVVISIVGAALCLVPNNNGLGAMNVSISEGTSGIITPAIVVSFLSFGRTFGGYVSSISQQTPLCALAFAGSDRVFKLLDQKPEIDKGKIVLVNAKYDENKSLVETNEFTGILAWKDSVNPNKPLIELKGDIELKDVKFGYDKDNLALKGISLKAHRGEKIAFVGHTGAGKTTITNLINNFYDINEGEILYDGINIKNISKKDLRLSISVVLQDTNLFTGTIKENIRYGKLDATDDEVYEAAKVANAYDFISRLPNGFDTELVTDGTNLSQGQRQLISIARAAIANTPLLILDEATSSIDTRTEVEVQKGTDQLMSDKTVFVIAHRLSTVQNSDRIVVLEKGQIIEQGSHNELIKLKGTYYQLYTGAFELD